MLIFNLIGDFCSLSFCCNSYEILEAACNLKTAFNVFSSNNSQLSLPRVRNGVVETRIFLVQNKGLEDKFTSQISFGGVWLCHLYLLETMCLPRIFNQLLIVNIHEKIKNGFVFIFWSDAYRIKFDRRFLVQVNIIPSFDLMFIVIIWKPELKGGG